MSHKALQDSSALTHDTVADLYAEFRVRVAEKKPVVMRTVEAFADRNAESLYALLNEEIGDGAFDTALQNAFDAGEIAPSLFHPMMATVIETASCFSEPDPDGHTVVVTEIFALPMSGTMPAILEASGSFEKLQSLARAFADTRYVSEGVQVILSPTTIDPLAATRLKASIAREMAASFAPYFDDEYTSQDAEDIFEVIQAPFEFLGDRDRNHMEDSGRVTRFIIGATQRTHSTTYPTNADAFLANMLDETSSSVFQETSDAFLARINEIAPGDVDFNMPLPIARATSFAAVATIADELHVEARAKGVRRSDFMFDEISLSYHGERLAAEAIVEGELLGPVLIPVALVERDRAWFTSMLDRMSDEFSEKDHMLISATKRN